MPTFVLLTRLIKEDADPFASLQDREEKVVSKVAKLVPSVNWIHDYALMGPWHYLDIFEAEDIRDAMKVSALVRHYGEAHTEVWPAETWKDFKYSFEDLSERLKEDDSHDRPEPGPEGDEENDTVITPWGEHKK